MRFLEIPRHFPQSSECSWDEYEAEGIYNSVDSLVPLFEQELATQFEHIGHQWDEGLMFYCWNETDGEPDSPVDETQLGPKAVAILGALRLLVPLYIDANNKRF